MAYNPETAELGEISRVPAAEVVFDPNVRTEIRLDTSFIASIRDRGFEQLPVGYTGDDARTYITTGQRRVSAALELGWPVIPVNVKPRAQAEQEAEVERIIEQLTENQQRANLTDSQTAAAHHQLGLFGLTEDQIARRTHTPRAQVATALKVAASPVATDAVTARGMNLEQAAILTEFENDAAAVEQLVTTAAERPQMLEHEAARIRQNREALADVDALAEKLEGEGWTVRKAANSWEVGAGPGAVDVRYLFRLRAGKPVRAGDHTSKAILELPGRVAVVFPANGRAGAVYYVTDPGSHGLVDAQGHSWTNTATHTLSEKQKDERREKRQAKEAMIAATEVRRTWIRDVLLNPARKTYPDTALVWIARDALKAPGTLRDTYGESGYFILETILGTKPAYDSARNPDTGSFYPGYQADMEKLFHGKVDPIRLALAAAVGHTEEVVGNPKADGFGQDVRTAAYLRQLAEWGYTLADVEQRIVDAADANRAAAAAQTKAAS